MSRHNPSLRDIYERTLLFTDTCTIFYLAAVITVW